MSVHIITIKARFDAKLTAKQARYAVWNAINGTDLWGDGRLTKRDPLDTSEPYGKGKITVRR